MTNWKRPEVPITVNFLRSHPNFIEWAVLAGSIKSMDFHRKIRDLVCPWLPDKGQHRADFQNPEFHIAYVEVAGYWSMFDNLQGLTADLSLGIVAFENLLVERVQQNKLAQDRAIAILEEVKLDLEIQFNPAEYIALIESDIFKAWHKSRVEADMLRKIATPGLVPATIESVKEIVRNAETVIRSQEKIVTFGMAAMPKKGTIQKPIPSGFFDLDRAMGGGFPVGSVTMIGGATGSGKTVLASTLLLQFAKLGISPMLVTTERPPGDYVIRMGSNFLDLDIETLRLPSASDAGSAEAATEDRPFPDWMYSDPNIGPKLDEFQQLVDRIAFADWAKNTGHTIVKDFDPLFEGLEPRRLDVVIFDWLGGGLAGRQNSQEIREVYLQAVRTLTEHARRKKRAIIVFAQLDKAAVKRNPTRPHHTMLTESKNMIDEVNVFFGISDVISGADGHSERSRTQFFNVTKSTLGPGGSCQVIADFEFQRFRDARQPGRLTPN